MLYSGSLLTMNLLRQLSTDTLALLQEFYDERNAQQKLLASLKQGNVAADGKEEPKTPGGPLDMSAFAEDWNASQFWNTDNTADILAAALAGVYDESELNPVAVAVVSAPSVFAGIKRLVHSSDSKTSRPTLLSKVKLLEYDTRFFAWPEFTFYDYNEPYKLPTDLKGSFDAILLDPPFLNDDCQTKMALTVRWLAKSWSSHSNSGVKIVVCTGERMAELVERLYGKVGVKMTDFEINHAKLANEYRCYANFEVKGVWKFIDGEE
jgi:EEF1A lysine methyltransferase 1